MRTATDVKKELQRHASREKAATYQRFFKTGPGQYGEGDVFIGLTVPEQRKVAKQFQELPVKEIVKLLESDVHEHRMTALIIMTMQFTAGNDTKKKEIYDTYIARREHINNWDLIDITTPRIVGEYLLDKPRDILYTLAKGGLWEKRIAILATFTFMKRGEKEDVLRLAEMYLPERDDLTHKATGWMLRELGKRVGEDELETFLQKHYDNIPRTTLRYAIERFPEPKRKRYLKGVF